MMRTSASKHYRKAVREKSHVQDHATKEKTADARLAESLTGIALAACAAIRTVDFRDAGTRHKADTSPVTLADEAAQAAILQGLARLLPDVPVASEEAACQWQGKAPREFVLVDPLDGTAEFLAGRLEYTVNIALVRNGIPAVGVVAAPALGQVWRGATDHGAERLSFSPGDTGTMRDARTIHTRPWPADERLAAVSRSHYDTASAAFLERIAPVRPVEYGSALKFCRVAEGTVDIYPRLAPTCEWDVAAGYALVAAAGGTVVTPDGAPLRFGRLRENFRIPGFIAWGDPVAARRLAM
jgi:3'(2'), 5'-bisphosphate nucleotidase